MELHTLFPKKITCLLWLLQSVATVTSQSHQVPTLKVIYKDNNRYFQVPEDAPLGFNLFQLEVTNGPGLRVESKSPYVKVNVITVISTTDRLLVNVTLAQKLDYDGEFKSAKLFFQYGNSDYQGLIYLVDLYVKNINDEVPVFLNQPYLITVPENTPQGTTLYTKIQANDRDEDAILTYNLEAKSSDVDEDYKTKFIISQDDATITLNGSLDYESNPFYQYTVKVSDSVHEVSTDVFITVLDIQDTPPEFIGAPFHATVEENANPMTPLLTIKAEDGDREAPNSIMFRIVTGSETCPGLFVVDIHSGEIRSTSVLDRDDGDVFNNNGVCSLTIEAVEGSEHPQGSSTSRSSSQTIVTITITDVDDNIPLFSANNFSAIIDENTQQGVPITTSTPILVIDNDQGNNAKFEIKVTNLPNIFEVSPSIVQTTSEILIRVKNSTYLDYEERQFIHIELEAKSVNAAQTTKSSKASIAINLKNKNDNLPVFTNFPTSISVEENKQNVKIMTISATDNDRNDDGQNFGTVSYSLDGLDQNFELSTTGELKVKPNANLDREIKYLYYLTVIAEDGGHNKVSMQININITDVNDNAPYFATNNYQTSLQENVTSFNRILKVHANDDDEQGKSNSEIEYSISSSKPSGLQSFFSIDPTTGLLSVVRALGKEGVIVLTIMAKDKGFPPLYTTVDATITIQTVNDNSTACQSRSAHIDSIENNATSTNVETTPNPTDNGNGNVHHDYVCHLNYMSIHIPVTLVPDSKLWLNEPSCELVNNGTHHIIDFLYEECGTDRRPIGNYTTFRNEITVHTDINVAGPVVFGEDYKINVSCSIPKYQLVDGSFQFVTGVPINEASENVTIGYVIKEYETADYLKEITKYPVQMPANQDMFFEVSLNDKDKTNNTFGVQVEQCIATPSLDPNDPTKFVLIENGCPKAYVHVMTSPGPEVYRFSIHSFHFTGAENKNNFVYIHCTVSLCQKSSCPAPCTTPSGRRKRWSRNRSPATLTIGPYIIAH